ncbi:hypothetical protein [Paenibacillus tianjinensis]|uniref:hypothetical protein n=1 Tax=Paenibacillus tianjinensis TaxID=2810347 RepID=UPI001E6218AD|nr:hypothetical protein [Paenibacillus tianjinensis]
MAINRNKQKSQVQSNEVQDESNIQIKGMDDFALHFAKDLLSSYSNPSLFNPIWQNEILKNLNMSPNTFDRDKIEQMIADPKSNEDALKDLGQYLKNVIMQFNRLVDLYAKILTFDSYIVPTNADEEDYKTNKFKKARKDVKSWVDKLNPKSTFPKIMSGVLLEDAKFYYVRESEDSVTLQEMPSKYCKIVRNTEHGHQYAFNMFYFLQAGVDIRDFHPDFIEYLENFLENKKSTDTYFYWQRLDPIKAPVFKFDETHAGLTPPLLGLFLDSAEIANYKKLLKTKTQLDVIKLLVNEIPMHSDSKGAQTKNNFAIDPGTAAQFTAQMQASLPDGYKAMTTPLKVHAVDFNQSQSRDNIVGYGQDNFYGSAGTSPVLFGEKNVNGTGLEASKIVDESYVIHMYRQFERFINAYLKTKSSRYRFKIHFPDITIFNRERKLDQYLKAAQSGYSKTLISVALGIDPDDMISLLMYENSIDMINKYLLPLQSSHVQTGEGGRPEMDAKDLGDAGVKTRDLQSNENR